MPEQDDITRDLQTCIRDGQRLAQRLDEEEQRTEALEEALRALVAKDPYWEDQCIHCTGWRNDAHEPDCPWVVARVLLGLKGKG